MEGTPFGPYRLLELLGRGGMGEVWRASTNHTSIQAFGEIDGRFELQPSADSSIRVMLSDWGKSVTVPKPPV